MVVCGNDRESWRSGGRCECVHIDLRREGTEVMEATAAERLLTMVAPSERVIVPWMGWETVPSYVTQLSLSLSHPLHPHPFPPLLPHTCIREENLADSS